MDTLDGKIRTYLEKARKGVAAQRPGAYPDTEDLLRYMNNELRDQELERMLWHLKSSPEDRQLIETARALWQESGVLEKGEAPRELVNRAKGLMGTPARSAACPHCGKAITPFKPSLGAQKGWSLVWFCGALASFGLSFVFRAYFIQFLVATLLFGVKFIVDQKAAKTQILIYKALQDEDKSHLHKPASRL